MSREDGIKTPFLSCALCVHSRYESLYGKDSRRLECHNTELVGYDNVTGQVNATNCGLLHYTNKCRPEINHKSRLQLPVSMERILAGQLVRRRK